MTEDSRLGQPSLETKSVKGLPAFEELSALTSIPFFENLDPKNVRILTKSFTRKTYEVGETVVQEGKAFFGFHVIVKGSVSVTAASEEGKEVQLATRHQSEHFGEIALVSEKKLEPVTVKAVERAVILSISAENFQEFVKNNPDVRVSLENHPSSIRVQLREIPFFDGIPEVKLQQLATLFEFKRCPENSVICRQGDPANGFYILVNGRVTASTSGPSGPVHLNTLMPKDYFGEIALLQKTVRTATLTAVMACTLLYLSAKRFETFLNLAPEIRESPSFAATISKRTANSLKAIPLFSFLQRKHVGPLEQYDERKLAVLGEMFKFIQVPDNTVIFREGQVADAFYIIVRGTCTVTARGGPDEKDEKKPSAGSPLASEKSHGHHGHETKGDKDKDKHDKVLTTHSSSVAAEVKVLLASLVKNDFFGEIGLLKNTRRTATVATTSPCVLLKLESQDFQRFIDIAPEMYETMQRVISVRTAQTLRYIPFFRNMKENKPWSKLGILGSMFEFEHFEEKQVVCREGQLGDKFYVIVEGSVSVSKAVFHEGKGSESVVLEVLKRDSFFGEVALVKEVSRLATVTCLEDCLFLTVTKAKFNKFVSLAPDLMQHFTSLVTHRTANVLRSIDFLHKNIVENKPWSKFELLCSMFSYECYDPKQVVVARGAAASEHDKFYIVGVGSVEVSAEDRREDGKIERKVFATLQAGQFFGEVTLLRNVPRTATITAVDPCVLFTLARDKFMQFLKLAPEAKPAIDRMYSDAVISTTLLDASRPSTAASTASAGEVKADFAAPSAAAAAAGMELKRAQSAPTSGAGAASSALPDGSPPQVRLSSVDDTGAEASVPGVALDAVGLTSPVGGGAAGSGSGGSGAGAGADPSRASSPISVGSPTSLSQSQSSDDHGGQGHALSQAGSTISLSMDLAFAASSPSAAAATSPAAASQ